MTIGGKNASQITITTADGELLAVVSDNEVIEKSGVSVMIDWG